jgi:hypothetical protein
MSIHTRQISTATIAGLCFVCLIVFGQGATCTPPPEQALDSDMDGIPDDGDNSGVAGDNPCADGQTTNCDDNCPQAANADQSDGDDDGSGDVCDPDPNDPNIVAVDSGSGGGGGGGGGSGGGGGGSGNGSTSTTVYLGQGASLGWTSIGPCSPQESGAGFADGWTRVDGNFAVIALDLRLPRGSAGTAYIECTVASQFTVEAEPNDSSDDPNNPPASETGWIIYEAEHLAGTMSASNYAITILIDVLGEDPAVPLQQGGWAYGDTVSPPLAFPVSASYGSQIPVTFRAGHTYSVEVLVRSGFGSAGADFGQHDGGNIDFSFNIGNLRVDFGVPE